MTIHSIRSETSYRNALRELSTYFDHEPEPASAEGERFELLVKLIEAYETRHSPIQAPARPTV